MIVRLLQCQNSHFFSEQHKKHVKWSERLIAKLCVKQSAWASVSTSKNFNHEPLLS